MSKEIELNCQNYSNFVKIGYGTYGTVYRATDNRNGLYVSIKEIIREKFKKEKEILKNEVDIMEKMKNENSVNIKEVIESNDYYYIVMEYCEYNLEEYINQKRQTPLSINEIKEVLNQLNNTFKLMQKEKIIHRDLKLSNILICLDKLDKNIIKLLYYSYSKIMTIQSMSFAGTPLTMAHEFLRDEN